MLWTLVFAAIYAIAGLLVLGPGPFIAFFTYHLPRVASGEAFAFFLNTDLTVTTNASVYAGASALWLLTLVAADTRGRAGRVALFVAAWILISVIPPPPDPKLTIALWLSCPAAMLVLAFWIALRRRTRDAEALPQPG